MKNLGLNQLRASVYPSMVERITSRFAFIRVLTPPPRQPGPYSPRLPPPINPPLGHI